MEEVPFSGFEYPTVFSGMNKHARNLKFFGTSEKLTALIYIP